MKKMIMMVMVLVVMFGFAATANAADKKDIEDYVKQNKGTVMELVDGSYEQELVYNTCTSIDVDGESYNLYKEGEIVACYDIENEWHVRSIHVIFELDEKLIDVDIDSESAIIMEL